MSEPIKAFMEGVPTHRVGTLGTCSWGLPLSSTPKTARLMGPGKLSQGGVPDPEGILPGFWPPGLLEWSWPPVGTGGGACPGQALPW